jgi:hypothetical protein
VAQLFSLGSIELMTKEVFISRQRALTRFGLTVTWLYVAGFGIFILWAFLAAGKIDMHWTSPAYKVCMFTYLLAGLPIVIMSQIRYAQKIGFVCPHCGRPFWQKPVARIVIATGVCSRCKTKILDDTPAA